MALRMRMQTFVHMRAHAQHHGGVVYRYEARAPLATCMVHCSERTCWSGHRRRDCQGRHRQRRGHQRRQRLCIGPHNPRMGRSAE